MDPSANEYKIGRPIIVLLLVLLLIAFLVWRLVVPTEPVAEPDYSAEEEEIKRVELLKILRQSSGEVRSEEEDQELARELSDILDNNKPADTGGITHAERQQLLDILQN